MSDTFETDGITLICGDCRDVLPRLSGVDCVIADPPFSRRTHAGHDMIEGGSRDGAKRSSLGYAAWDDKDVESICAFLPTAGWVCIFSDHVLVRSWEMHLREVGRCVFAPLPVITPGRSVRLNGDGPSSWTDWLIVSRTAAESKWGTLPGMYQGARGQIEHMGGKPISAMQSIVCDYSRVENTVLDFCMGSGTTGIACIRTGRRFIGIEKDPAHFTIAAERIKRELAQPMLPALAPMAVAVQEQML